VNGHLVERGLLDFKAGQTVFLVVDTGCRYFGEIAFPDKVSAGLRVAELGRSSVRYEIGLFRNDEEEARAEGHFVHVNVGREDRRPRPIDEATRAVLQALVPGQGDAQE
jgi:acyl-CoA thioester hydrolase